MSDFVKEYFDLSNKIIEDVTKFSTEALKNLERINNLDSTTLKGLLTKMSEICASICENLNCISKLLLDNIRLSNEYKNKISETIFENSRYIENELKNFNDFINNDTKSKTVIKLRLSLLKKDVESINAVDNLHISSLELSDYLDLMDLKIMLINIEQCCLPFYINDYGKYREKNQHLKESIKFTVGLIPGLSEIVAFADMISLIEKAANIENYDDLETDFYNTSNNNLKIIEKQILMLNTAKEKQKEIIDYLRKRNNAKQDLLKNR